MTTLPPVLLHASAAEVAGNGVLILGASGAGKSGLVLAMLALGARLVADDQVQVSREGDALRAEAPAALRGKIEARGIGILEGLAFAPARLVLAVDLGRAPDARMPQAAHFPVLGLALPLISGREVPNLASALMLKLGAMTGQKRDPPEKT